MDWLDLFAVQGTLKSLFQHHSSEASIPWHSAFFMVQLSPYKITSSHPYRTTRKTIALSISTFVSKVKSLLFNMLCSFVIAFLPRIKCLVFLNGCFPPIQSPTLGRSIFQGNSEEIREIIISRTDFLFIKSH